MTRLIFPFALVTAMIVALAACGGDDPTATPTAPAAMPAPTATPAAMPDPTVAPAPTAAADPTEMPDPTAAPDPTAIPAATATPVPTAAAQAAVVATALPEATPIPPTPTPEPEATATPLPVTEEELLAEYAATVAGGPGAIFVGEPTDQAAYAQLIGPPVHEGLVFLPAEAQAMFGQLFQVAMFGSEQFGVSDHLFIYTSDYYQGLIEKANLLNPTELTSSGEDIEIQHVCLSRGVPPCVIMAAYMAPRLAERTNGQVKLEVTSLFELGLTGQDNLRQIETGTLDMANIYTGYVSGELPAIEVQSLWGMGPDWETTYLALADMVPDIERMLVEETGGAVVNRNWFAGVDQWFFSKEPLQTLEDFEGKKVRTHATSLSRLIEGLGAEPLFVAPGQDYLALQNGTIDVSTTGALLAVDAKYYEIADYMAGPVIGFGYTTNVINGDLWARIPPDIQQIIIEEGARAELEALRIAPYHNVLSVFANQTAGIQPVPFSGEIGQYIAGVVFPEYVVPDWVNRLGYPERNQDAVRIFNEHAGPYLGLRIEEDGTVSRVEITKGPRARQ